MDNIKGKFIVFEGGEACGKSSQINLLKEKFKNNHDIIFTREPGGTEVAEEIRRIVTTGAKDKILPETELALIYAARNEHFQRKIIPALKNKKTIICDRCYLSSFVYQGAARKLAPEFIEIFNNVFLQNTKADLTILLDLDIKEAAKRTNKRGNDTINERFEQFDPNFHQKIRTSFLKYAEEDNLIKVIDATQSKEATHQTILNLLTHL